MYGSRPTKYILFDEVKPKAKVLRHFKVNVMTKFPSCLYLSDVECLPVDVLVAVGCSNLSQIPLRTLNPDPGSSEG